MSKTIKSVKEAASIIRSSGLVAFPTDTFYALGANALDARAVGKVFKAKQRPRDKALIVLVANKKQAREIAEVTPRAEELMDKHWPGPVTIILKKKEKIPSVTSANQDTIAVRMPDNETALALIREAGMPITAPSANKSGNPPPVTAEQVIRELNEKIDAVLDGGPTTGQLPSTIIDLSKSEPKLIRTGAIKLEEIP